MKNILENDEVVATMFEYIDTRGTIFTRMPPPVISSYKMLNTPLRLNKNKKMHIEQI